MCGKAAKQVTIMSHSRPISPRPLRRSEASTYLYETYGVSRSLATLAKLACQGGGPVFRHAGRVPLYEVADLDRWVATIMSGKKASTSDAGA
jgi:hypothetical protein